MRFRFPLLSTVLAAALLAGCKTAPTNPPSASAAATTAPAASQPNAATRAAATKGHLAIEKVRLTELFKGTPVVFGLLADGSLRADVPMQFSFDAGKAVIKPPLAAVLDRIAAGQRDEITRVLVSAPADAGAKASTLPADRAAAVRAYLTSHGVVDARSSVVAAAGATTVRLVVTDAPALP